MWGKDSPLYTMIKMTLFLIASPFVALPVLFLHWTYGDKDGNGGYQGLWDGDWKKKTLAAILAPVYFPIIWYVQFVMPKWEGLLD